MVSGVLASPLWICVCIGFDGEFSYISYLRWFWVYNPAGRDVSYDADTNRNAWIGWQRVSNLIITGATIFSSLIIGFLAYYRMSPEFRARNVIERIILWGLVACSSIAIFTTIGIVLSVLFESIRFFKLIPFQDFIFGFEVF